MLPIPTLQLEKLRPGPLDGEGQVRVQGQARAHLAAPHGGLAAAYGGLCAA